MPETFETLIRYSIPGAILLLPFLLIWFETDFHCYPSALQGLALLYIGASIPAGFLLHQGFLAIYERDAWRRWNFPQIQEVFDHLQDRRSEEDFRDEFNCRYASESDRTSPYLDPLGRGREDSNLWGWSRFAWHYYVNRYISDWGSSMTRWRYVMLSLGSTGIALLTGFAVSFACAFCLSFYLFGAVTIGYLVALLGVLKSFLRVRDWYNEGCRYAARHHREKAIHRLVEHGPDIQRYTRDSP